MLCDPEARAVHELSPGAAAVWSGLDERPLAGHLSGLEPLDRGDLIELLRRLRALGLVDDGGDPRSAADPGPERAASPVTSLRPVELSGVRIDSEIGVLVALERWDHSSPTRVELHAGPVDAGVRGFVVIRADREPIRLSPLEALAALVESASPTDLSAGALDRLAQVAEAHPTVQLPDLAMLGTAAALLGA